MKMLCFERERERKKIQIDGFNQNIPLAFVENRQVEWIESYRYIYIVCCATLKFNNQSTPKRIAQPLEF